MPRYRDRLPQLDGALYLTDGGIETDLIFNEGLELPLFAAVDLIRTAEGRGAIERYFRKYIAIASDYGLGFLLETPTWRASADWGERLGYEAGLIDRLNADAVELLAGIRGGRTAASAPVVISGCVGPRGDGYDPGVRMSAEEAADYHSAQIGVFSRTVADQVSAITMNYVEEAIGVARAAAWFDMPVAISFTVETDGRLPTGQGLAEAIAEVDATAAPAYYMLNCAHPTHYELVLEQGGAWTERIRGMRANASTASHAELDEAETLDDGHPAELGADYARILRRHPQINVLGGCCGTDHRHVGAIAVACARIGVL